MMPLRVIELEPADTFYSVRDRLLQAGRTRTVLVWPREGVQLGGVDLVLLRRLADRERLEVGLVTGDRHLSRRARAVGLPTFANLTLAERYRPGWWRAGRRSEWLGFAPGAAPRPASQLIAPRYRLYGLVAFFFAIILLALALTGILFAIPRATVTLYPGTRPVQVILDLTADPALTEQAGHSLSARAVEHTQVWEATGRTSGDETADQQRIRAQAMQGVGAAAPELLAARLEPGEIFVPNSTRLEVVEESFTAGEETSNLYLRVLITGAAVAAADLNRLAYGELAAALPDGYEPDAGSLRLLVESLPAGEWGHFRITAQATGRPDVDPQDLAGVLRGRRKAEAIGYLNAALPMAQPPVIDFRPGWWWEFGLFPLRGGNIDVRVNP